MIGKYGVMYNKIAYLIFLYQVRNLNADYFTPYYGRLGHIVWRIYPLSALFFKEMPMRV